MFRLFDLENVIGINQRNYFVNVLFFESKTVVTIRFTRMKAWVDVKI